MQSNKLSRYSREENNFARLLNVMQSEKICTTAELFDFIKSKD